MNKFEYYCCWIDVFNAAILQEFLDERGSQGWQIDRTLPSKDPNDYKTLFIFKKELNKVIDVIT
jgi:hypothetical protein